ncbi:hypothetical protein AcV5_005635 [Taiwanofungus camphoratus]|nr:hypothetical protein AcV5_005635 [Antrodia cinnamomea]
MVGTKRAAEEGAGPTTRSAKAPKTDKLSSPATRKGGKKGPKATMATSAFKVRAMPLHVNVTHTPPAISDDAETTAVASTDPGFIGTTTLVPSSFATGSYGWKGSKRLTVELQNADGAEGEKEKVHVMLTINATVMGSKGAKEGEDEGEEAKEEGPENGAEAKEEQAENGLEERAIEADITEAAQETEGAADITA